MIFFYSPTLCFYEGFDVTPFCSCFLSLRDAWRFLIFSPLRDTQSVLELQYVMVLNRERWKRKLHTCWFQTCHVSASNGNANKALSLAGSSSVARGKPVQQLQNKASQHHQLIDLRFSLDLRAGEGEKMERSLCRVNVNTRDTKLSSAQQRCSSHNIKAGSPQEQKEEKQGKEVISSPPFICYLGKETKPHLTPVPFQWVLESKEDSRTELPFLQTKPQVP